MGGGIWNGQSFVGSSILKYFFNNYAAVLEHTHSTETEVKEGNFTSKKGRYEQQSSDLVALRSGSFYKIPTRELKSTRNQIR